MARIRMVGALAAAHIAVVSGQHDLAHYPRAAANTTLTAAPTVSGQASHNCSWSWDSWLSASNSQASITEVNVTSTYTYHNITASTTVLCDNITRIVGDLTTTATGTNVTIYENYTTVGTDFKQPTPTCSLSAEDCLSVFLWDDEERFKYCTRPTTSVQKLCGPCGIVGGTIDLLYFPPPKQTPPPDLCATTGHSPTLCPLGPTTATNNATNPYENMPCYYATGSTSTENSGPYITSNGHTFYENRAYISLASVYATDRCGYVGDHHSGTIVEVASTDVYSIGGYHHNFADNGYSFNFQDLYNPPSSAYYLNCNGGGGMQCVPQQGTRYSMGTDFINGASNIDLGYQGSNPMETQMWIWPQAYAPIILMPTQIRSLDPAWSTCILDLAGLYDPPRALTKTDAAGPTTPTPYDPVGGPTTTAKPGSSPGNSGPEPTTTLTTVPPAASPVIQPSGTALETPTVAHSPAIQPTDDGGLDTPADGGDGSLPTNSGSAEDHGNSGNGGGDSDGGESHQDPQANQHVGGGANEESDSPQESPSTQNVGGMVASLLGNGGTEAPHQGETVQPTSTVGRIGDVIASVLGMQQSPSAEQPEDGTDAPAPASVAPAGGSATSTASSQQDEQSIHSPDATQTTTAASGAGTSVAVDGESHETDGPSSQTSGTGDASTAVVPPAGSASPSGDAAPQQTGNAGSRVGVEQRVLALLAGAGVWLARQ